MFIIAIVFSGSLAWVSMALGSVVEGRLLSAAFWPSLFSLFGGFLFGIGAAINSGCGVSTVSRLARGEVVMLATILGWFVAWLLFAPVLPTELKGSRLVLSDFSRYAFLGSISLIIVVSCYFMNAVNRKLWLSMLGIGLTAGFVFLYEPHWTPSGLLKSMGTSLWHGKAEDWPSSERFILMISLLVGMVSAALFTGSFSLRLSPIRRLGKHLVAGVLMGLGAVMAGGGNDTQLLVAMPVLSLAGVFSVLSIIVGIYTGVKLIQSR
ncbi:YeeE/YedE thiosulfate transporter family protein [Vibrio splendidus]|uniref:YeeE/YedE thiosulfate transporter family protein n=1 Tax=Vibrio splendidus TaxID=29497 RepID=UPI000C8575FA|nr:YeeE/YedE thiosulfate transporter family protein [Vibrio splendidus]